MTASRNDQFQYENSSGESVDERIFARLDRLRAWSDAGRVPVGKSIPKNLLAARLWDDPELGIAPINSPNDFTTTHDRHGEQVEEIRKLIGSLRVIAPVFDAKGKISGRKQARNDLTFVVSQWQTERARNLKVIKDAQSARAGKAMSEREAKRLREEVANLTHQLAVLRGGPKAVK